ncbi:hypothetical protein RUMCAL_02402 [Ruminococcus callidus ATCC 27760]|uniref:Uncharacterized protein n=1 Tax=Ruminococcus callidus ATCC 27760 TaxID=411473 RepID=U2LZI8_9FIRM|nr:hypothetical protein RUMCAL_02402 [Ruminococcus callidus ATCC 27760]
MESETKGKDFSRIPPPPAAVPLPFQGRQNSRCRKGSLEKAPVGRALC